MRAAAPSTWVALLAPAGVEQCLYRRVCCTAMLHACDVHTIDMQSSSSRHHF
jgi:hypothetical protein